MRAQWWTFGVGTPVGLVPLGILGDSPNPLRWTLALAFIGVAGLAIAGLFDDGSAEREQLTLSAMAGVAFLPLATTFLVDWS